MVVAEVSKLKKSRQRGLSMNKILLCICLICITLNGCHKQDYSNRKEINKKEEYTIDESLKYDKYTSDDDLFRVILYIEKGPYTTDKNIEIYSTLEYIGDYESIEIWHGIPYFNYQIFDGEKSFLDGLTLTVLKKTTLNKNEVYIKPFVKNGAWSDDDPDAEFWKEYYADENLKLPTGSYTLTAFCNFKLSEDGDEYNNHITININVK
jgi:hypothetical protein